MKILPIITLLAAISQLVGVKLFAGFNTLGVSAASLPIFIQPSSWTFSIWGPIYILSIAFAVYQVIPRNDNQLLRAIRLPATIVFLSSSAWLYFASSGASLLWLTAPTLFIMATALGYIVMQPKLSVYKYQFISGTILLPYAAWTGIAQWLNIQVLLVQKNIITNAEINIISNVLLLFLAAAWSWYFFRISEYSKWYGLVVAWASFGIISSNVIEGSMIVAAFAGALCISSLLCIKNIN